MPPMDPRLDAIEEKLAHLERAVAEISDVVARQQKQLDAALDRNQRLMEKISAIESDFGPSATAHEKPPHY
jgi:SlyX protein